MRLVLSALCLAALAACGGRTDAGCVPVEALSYDGPDVVVMATGCGAPQSRPATAADIARLEPPL